MEEVLEPPALKIESNCKQYNVSLGSFLLRVHFDSSSLPFLHLEAPNWLIYIFRYFFIFNLILMNYLSVAAHECIKCSIQIHKYTNNMVTRQSSIV